jgi:hypothetical protein
MARLALKTAQKRPSFGDELVTSFSAPESGVNSYGTTNIVAHLGIASRKDSYRHDSKGSFGRGITPSSRFLNRRAPEIGFCSDRIGPRGVWHSLTAGSSAGAPEPESAAQNAKHPNPDRL